MEQDNIAETRPSQPNARAKKQFDRKGPFFAFSRVFSTWKSRKTQHSVTWARPGGRSNPDKQIGLHIGIVQMSSLHHQGLSVDRGWDMTHAETLELERRLWSYTCHESSKCTNNLQRKCYSWSHMLGYGFDRNCKYFSAVWHSQVLTKELHCSMKQTSVQTLQSRALFRLHMVKI